MRKGVTIPIQLAQSAKFANNRGNENQCDLNGVSFMPCRMPHARFKDKRGSPWNV
jgi:hypothetical protein